MSVNVHYFICQECGDHPCFTTGFGDSRPKFCMFEGTETNWTMVENISTVV